MPARLPKVGSTYYFRRGVPPRLRPYFLTEAGKPRTEFMISLEEKDLPRAKDKWLAQAVQVAAWLNEAEAKLAKGVPPPKPPSKASEPLPPGWSPWRTREEFEHWEEADRLDAEQDAAREEGIVDPIQRARQEGAEAALARRDRQDREIREAFADEEAVSKVPLMDLFDAYAAERKPAPATVKRWRPVMSDLIAFLGHDDAARITTAKVVAWKKALLAEKKTNGEPVRLALTVRETYIASLRVVLEYGKENGQLKANAAADVKVRAPKKTRNRDPGFTSDEALTILRATLQPQPSTLTPEHRLARRWIPWLCAYTGARVGEMAQLRAEDVTETDGVWALRITPEAGSTKSGNARVVPLHPHLIEQGFPAVATKKGKGPLFYNPKLSRGGSDSNPHYKKIGERLGAWVRKLGVNDPDVQPNHAWRHLFKTQARLVRMDPEAREAIPGHAQTTEGQKYGVYPLPTLAEEVAKLPRFQV